jgi:TorA maturation chaperone TorD
MTEPQHATLEEEDRARAHCYALISRLFYAPADQALLQSLAAGAPGGAINENASGASALRSASSESEAAPADFAAAFAVLRRAAHAADPESLRQEYDDLFIGAGKAVVTPYTSGYSLPHAPDRHLVSLREQLTAWGLSRRSSVFEVEDHVSAVCDAMRWLIESGQSLDVQRGFFDEFVYTGVGLFCDAVQASPSSSFYRAAGGLTRAFMTVENEGFLLHAAE